jgi:aspartyl-tRNA(Asn)/glutamyl-tRNA(Gln) amidotransferase subunit B
MEEGALRCDANVSVRPRGQQDYGVKTEIKNMNSFRAVERAIAYEAERQIHALRAGETIHQETRGWVEERGVTVSQRSKEYAHDYRYFPEPDLPPLVISREWVERLRAAMPELPDAKSARFLDQYGLGAADAEALVSSRALAEYFEATVAAATAGEPTARARAASNWIQNELKGLLFAQGRDITTSPLTPEALAGLLDAVASGAISGKQGKAVLEQALASGEPPTAIIAREGISQLSDAGELERIVDAVLASNPRAVEDYRAGKASALAFLVGQVMKQTKGRARPDVVNPLLLGKLGGP